MSFRARFSFHFIACLGLSLLLSLVLTAQLTAEELRHGFRLLEKRFVKEVGAECLCFEHVKTGAHLIKIAASDANKTFAIAFRTIPDSDAGMAHILEHSVLDGSRRYPVKSPFSTLAKGSLSTFINAMTGPDFTIYPAATMNEKDYFNFMDVYCDAVFHPLIYDDAYIFMQEGWHYELKSPQEPLTVKGVVYNEMKGNYSSPDGKLYRLMRQNLFPDNCYRWDSGGDPAAIPTLTREKFLAFHQRYYHPSNAWFFLYGNGDLDRELAKLDTVLNEFPRRETAIDLKPQSPLPGIKEITETYAVPEGPVPERQSRVALAWFVGDGTDRKLGYELGILAYALVGHESAPLRLALRQADIGNDVQAYAIGNSLQSGFMISVRDAKPGQQEKFKQTVMATLQKVLTTGLDSDTIQGNIDRIEFSLRENNTAFKGLKYLFSQLPYWMTTGQRFSGLEFEQDLAAIKEDVKNDILEKIIRTRLLDNPHAVLVALNPEPGLEKKTDAEAARRLAEVKAKLSPDEVEKLVQATTGLIAYQKREDSPAALATIPMLERSDLNPKPPCYEARAETIAAAPVLYYDAFTGGIVYLNCYFDLRTLPEDLIPYAALLSDIIGKLNTAHHTFGTMQNAVNRNTGGISYYVNVIQEKRNADLPLPQFVVTAKFLTSKTATALSLIDEILTSSRFDDAARLKELLVRFRSQLETRLKNDGMGYAASRFSSYNSRTGVINERLDGLDYYYFIKDLADNFDARSGEIAAKLNQTASLLFSRSNLTLGITGSKDEYQVFAAAVPEFVGALAQTPSVFNDWKLPVVKKNEALSAASKVQFVIQGGNYQQAGYQWNGKMPAVVNIINNDWLWNQVRVLGGAYGGFCSISPNGRLAFYSYRDPNLKETLAIYAAVPDYLRKLQLSDKEMTRYLIGAVAGQDAPMSPAEAGSTAFRRHFEKIPYEQRCRERTELLSITPADVRATADLIAAGLKDNTLCVYGNEEKIRKEKALFQTIVPLNGK